MLSTATCDADEGLHQASYSVDFTQGASDDWTVTYGNVTYDDTKGAVYTIAESGDAPTVQFNKYIFFGSVSVVMQTAPGTGIISCAILESDDLDEIDWEWLGGRPTQVETNYFGKGNTSTWDRETYIDMANTQTEFHNYTVVWTKQTLEWLIDGSVVRSLAYADANSGNSYPQTPMRVKLGIWAGGDSSNSEGTIEWAGGATDYSDGPFTAYVKSVQITNYNPASSYTYGDKSGKYSSIVIDGSDGDTKANSAETSSAAAAASSATSSVTSPAASSSVMSSASTLITTSKASAAAAATSDGSSSSSGTSSSANSANPTESKSSSSSISSSSSSSPSSSSSSDSSSSSSSSSTLSAASGSSSVVAASDAAAAWHGSMPGAPMLLALLGCFTFVLA